MSNEAAHGAAAHTRAEITRTPEETQAVGMRLAAQLGGGELISLEGDLGAGKSVFVRGLAAGLGLDPERLASPTFVLAIEHRGGRVPLTHVDLYRLPEQSGVDELGIEEALAAGHVVAVEWGERLPAWLRALAIRITLREVEATGLDEPPRALGVVFPRDVSDGGGGSRSRRA